MTNANDDTTSSYGRLSQIALTACRSPLSVRLTLLTNLSPSNSFLSSYSRWKNLLLSRWPQSRSPIHGTDSPDYATNRRARSRIIMWLVVVRSRQRHYGLGWEWSWSQFHFRSRGEFGVESIDYQPLNLDSPLDCRKILGQARLWLDLSRSSGSRRRLWVFRKTSTGYTILGAQLLWRVRQRRWVFLVQKTLSYHWSLDRLKVILTVKRKLSSVSCDNEKNT